MKRIITCSDGTWNQPGTEDKGIVVKTNVEKIYQLIKSNDAGIEQVKYYDQGVGTGLTLKSKIIGGATGAGIDKNIKDVYTFLVLNYEPGDEIYLFGFSRGAYTARSVVGFIRNCGILKPQNLHLLDKAYDLYRERNAYTSPDSDLMLSFKEQYAEQPKIKMIGVWDTVGSLGIPLPAYKLWNLKRYKFHDVSLSNIVENAYQALGIDEKRALFAPTLWQQKDTLPAHQYIEQRWFAGVHSNIGGGYANCALSNITLKWMIKKAENLGLGIDDFKADENCDNLIRNSYTLPYWLWRPQWRSILQQSGSYEVIDESVLERFKENKKYRPQNLLKLKEFNIENSPQKLVF